MNLQLATPLRRTPGRRCIECGASTAGLKGIAEFCSDACRIVFNNRRLKRGAELYDLFMALRYDRAIAYPMKLWTLVCRMARSFHEEDEIKRDGRKSWRHPREIVERRPYLRAERLRQGRRQ